MSDVDKKGVYTDIGSGTLKLSGELHVLENGEIISPENENHEFKIQTTDTGSYNQGDIVATRIPGEPEKGLCGSVVNSHTGTSPGSQIIICTTYVKEIKIENSNNWSMFSQTESTNITIKDIENKFQEINKHITNSGLSEDIQKEFLLLVKATQESAGTNSFKDNCSKIAGFAINHLPDLLIYLPPLKTLVEQFYK